MPARLIASTDMVTTTSGNGRRWVPDGLPAATDWFAFEVDATQDPDGNSVLFVPSDRVRLEIVPEGHGLPVTARRYLGLSVELTITHANGNLVTHAPVDASERFPIGSFVRVTADRRDCRLLPDD